MYLDGHPGRGSIRADRVETGEGLQALFGVIGPIASADVEEMARRLAHRGPRLESKTLSNDILFGAIGSDPRRAIAEIDGRVIVCSARLANFDELADLLPDDVGVETEAELLLALYLTRGPDSLAAADGELAFVIVDHEADEIVFGRDFFGSAPLYYTVLPDGGFAFASEYKALLALPEVAADPDRNMLQYLQHAKKLPPGRTLLESINAALPGSVTRLQSDGELVTALLSRPLEVVDVIHDERTAVDAVRHALIDATRRKTAELNPLGLALSGGIDSIGLAFLLRHLYPDREIHTFTAGYGPGDRDLDTAAEVARDIGSKHHEVFTRPALLSEELPRLVWHLEDPFARSEVLQLYEIGKAASPHVDVLVTGQGSDSLFAGMPRYKLLRLLQRLPFMRDSLLEIYDRATRGLLPQRAAARLMAKVILRDNAAPVPTIVGADYVAERKSLSDFGPEFVNRQMAAGYQAGQAQDTLKYERSFAASGLGYRSPFVDEAFARTAFRVSDRLKIRGLRDKYILRQALQPFVPAHLLKLPKFAQRMQCDLGFSDTLDRVADLVLTEEAVEERGLMDPAALAALRRRDPTAAYPYENAMRVWTAVLTELWAREFLDRRGAGNGQAIDRELERQPA